MGRFTRSSAASPGEIKLRMLGASGLQGRTRFMCKPAVPASAAPLIPRAARRAAQSRAAALAAWPTASATVPSRPASCVPRRKLTAHSTTRDTSSSPNRGRRRSDPATPGVEPGSFHSSRRATVSRLLDRPSACSMRDSGSGGAVEDKSPPSPVRVSPDNTKNEPARW